MPYHAPLKIDPYWYLLAQVKGKYIDRDAFCGIYFGHKRDQAYLYGMVTNMNGDILEYRDLQRSNLGKWALGAIRGLWGERLIKPESWYVVDNPESLHLPKKHREKFEVIQCEIQSIVDRVLSGEKHIKRPPVFRSPDRGFKPDDPYIVRLPG